MRSSNEMVSQRRDKVLDYISTTGKTTTELLAKEFGVSIMTARRDLLYLMEKKLVRKSSSGLFMVDNNTVFMKDFNFRLQQHTPEKQAIARECLQFIKDGDLIGTDASTSVLTLCKMIPQEYRLTLVTLSQMLPMMMEDHPNVTTVSTGGISLKGHASYVGSIAISTLSTFHFDKTFLSTSAFDPALGLCDYSEELSNKSKLMEHSAETYLLCDSSKLGKNSLHYLFIPANITAIITDWKITPEQLSNLHRYNYNVIVAPPAAR